MSQASDLGSRASRTAGLKNAHCRNSLQLELDQLKEEQARAIKNIEHDVRQIEISKGPPLTRPTRARSSSPHRGGITRTKMDSHYSNAHQTLSTRAAAEDEASSLVPPIIVSHEAEAISSVPGKFTSRRRKSLQHTPSWGYSLSMLDSASERGNLLSRSLHPPVHRPRSNSAPLEAILPPFLSSHHRRPSLCHDLDLISSDLHVPAVPRARSSSFSMDNGPVRRRGSITERWERQLPVMGSARGRRRSVDLGNLVRDLRYGIPHRELMDQQLAGPSLFEQQFEQLKQCRYLRMPTGQNSEDISEEFN